MPLALTARISVKPEHLLLDKRIHDMAHDFLAARIRAEIENKKPAIR